MAMDVPWFVRNKRIYKDLEWEPVTEFMKRKAERIFDKAKQHPNEELRRLVDYDPTEEARRSRTYHRRPRDQLRI